VTSTLRCWARSASDTTSSSVTTGADTLALACLQSSLSSPGLAVDQRVPPAGPDGQLASRERASRKASMSTRCASNAGVTSARAICALRCAARRAGGIRCGRSEAIPLSDFVREQPTPVRCRSAPGRWRRRAARVRAREAPRRPTPYGRCSSARLAADRG